MISSFNTVWAASGQNCLDPLSLLVRDFGKAKKRCVIFMPPKDEVNSKTLLKKVHKKLTLTFPSEPEPREIDLKMD